MRDRSLFVTMPAVSAGGLLFAAAKKNLTKRELYMNNLEQFYASVGSDAAEVVGRLGGNAALVMRFLAKFQEDGSFRQLCAALDGSDTETAFRAAHTLKGASANLGLQTLFIKASEMTELLRGGAVDEAETALPGLREEYDRVCSLIAELN